MLCFGVLLVRCEPQDEREIVPMFPAAGCWVGVGPGARRGGERRDRIVAARMYGVERSSEQECPVVEEKCQGQGGGA